MYLGFHTCILFVADILNIILVLSIKVIISYYLIPSWNKSRTNEACDKKPEPQTKKKNHCFNGLDLRDFESRLIQ